MLFDPSTADHLKPWLTKTLEPICDAEPGALADYILALLKHNAPEIELRKELASQLDEFLEKEGPSFIDMLFTTLRTKSYLPYSTSSPPSSSHAPVDNGIPIPLDAFMSPSMSSSPERGRKRNMEYDDRDGRPAKGPRLTHDGQYAGYPRGHDNWSNGGYGRGGRGRGGAYGGADMGMDVNMGGMGMNGRGQQQYRPPDQKKGICRDYHNNGYCARGAYCKFSHGEDAFVPGQIFPMNAPQMTGGMFIPPFANGGMGFGSGNGPAAAYDPHEAHLDMRPTANLNIGVRPPRPPITPRVRGENGDTKVPLQTSGELPVIQDLTPREPKDENASQPNGSSAAPGPSREGMTNGVVYPLPAPLSFPVKMEVDMDTSGQSAPLHQTPRGMRPMRIGRGRGSRPGTFNGDVQRFRPERRNDKTLVVEKIPEDKLSLETVNGWFKQFGTVTNVAIDASTAKALVSFSTHEEAHAAWKSEEAVFNNRFVKLFWHRPLEGHGQTGQRMLAASAPLVANIASRDHPEADSTSTGPSPSAEVPSPSPSTHLAPAAHARKASTVSSATVSALAAKQQLLEQQIAEQKSLMDQLSTASPAEKKEILTRLRKLGEEMKPASVPASAATVPSTSATGKRPSISTTRSEDHEQKERARLDKELELHSAALASDGGEDTTESLKEKLAKLKAEAASLGIDPATETAYGSPYRGYRGRGRGARSYYRGAMRGGPPRSSMKLDNRPKKLLVKDVTTDSLQAVRDWFETTGQVDSIDHTESGDVIISFKSRSGAEQGLAKGNNIPLAGQKQISWLAGSQPTQPSASKPVPSTAATPESSSSMRHELDVARRPGPEPLDIDPEEEMIVSGWGGDGEDEDGMGML